MIHRRLILATLPLSAFALSADSLLRAQEAPLVDKSIASSTGQAIASPPVVQHRTHSGFTVVFKAGCLATGWIDWGTSPDTLDNRCYAQDHGLKTASDLALSIRVEHGKDLGGTPIYYRISAVPLTIEGRKVHQGPVELGTVHKLRAYPESSAPVHIAIINDTHENEETIKALSARLEELDPDFLIWNGDTTNDFHPEKDVASILLSPGKKKGPDEGGWASTRPLMFVPGNHDVRGRLAYQLQSCLPGWPGGSGNSGVGVPYCSMHRVGPLAFVTLDTGEDKPDAHPSFQGTAAYEPYREQQGRWLSEAVQHPDFKSAPYKIAICHIPLRGLEGHNDGTTMEGFAYYSGFGAKAWLATLVENQVQTIISGHMHNHRIDAAQDGLPTQIVLGGPQKERATLTRIVGDANDLTIYVEDLAGKILIEHKLTPKNA